MDIMRVFARQRPCASARAFLTDQRSIHLEALFAFRRWSDDLFNRVGRPFSFVSVI